MRFLVSEQLGPHKYKTAEGYLICTGAILSRTGKQEYKRSELFGDACDDPEKIVDVERIEDEVFSDKAMSSFENKPVCMEHPDENITAENHNNLSVGFVRDVHKGDYNGNPVMRGTLVITDKDAIEAIESGEYCELSCGYDCDIKDGDIPQQTNIRGNHVALCKQGRAGIARIIDSAPNMIQASRLKPGMKINYKGGEYEVLNIEKSIYGGELEITLKTKTGQRILETGAQRSFTLIDEVKNMNDSTQNYNDFNNMLNNYSMHRQQLYRILDLIRSDEDLTDDERKKLLKKGNELIEHTHDAVETNDDLPVKVTTKPGTDKIIYTMQSNADKKLYFYIGKTFSMKEGSFGYTKYEMNGASPDALKKDLAANGWHQVNSGIAKIIDEGISKEQNINDSDKVANDVRTLTSYIKSIADKKVISNNDEKSIKSKIDTALKDIKKTLTDEFSKTSKHVDKVGFQGSMRKVGGYVVDLRSTMKTVARKVSNNSLSTFLLQTEDNFKNWCNVNFKIKDSTDLQRITKVVNVVSKVRKLSK